MRTRALSFAALCLAVTITPAMMAASHTAEDDSAKLRRAVSAEGILLHEAAFQAIGLLKNGNRLAGAPGHDASAAYVAAVSRAAGLQVSFDDFEYDLDFLADFKAPVLTVVTPGHRRAFVPGIFGAFFGGDFGSMFNSPSTDITAKVWAVDLNLPAPAAPNSNTSGCEPADFAGMPAGSIALIQRGTCLFVQKWANAVAAGAARSCSSTKAPQACPTAPNPSGSTWRRRASPCRP